jgi:thioredoxin-related protein
MKTRILLASLFLTIFTQVDVQAQSQSEINSGFEWLSLDEAQKKAKETGKSILLFGYAEWCTYCLKMRKESFPDSSVQKSISDYYLPVQLNGESEERVVYNGKTMPARELARYLQLVSFPTHYFINSKGEVLGAQKGFIEPEVYSPLLDYVGSGAFGSMGFEEFLEKEGKLQEGK